MLWEGRLKDRQFVEEVVARDFLMNENPQPVINIVDASNPNYFFGCRRNPIQSE